MHVDISMSWHVGQCWHVDWFAALHEVTNVFRIHVLKNVNVCVKLHRNSFSISWDIFPLGAPKNTYFLSTVTSLQGQDIAERFRRQCFGWWWARFLFSVWLLSQMFWPEACRSISEERPTVVLFRTDSDSLCFLFSLHLPLSPVRPSVNFQSMGIFGIKVEDGHSNVSLSFHLFLIDCVFVPFHSSTRWLTGVSAHGRKPYLFSLVVDIFFLFPSAAFVWWSSSRTTIPWRRHRLKLELEMWGGVKNWRCCC